MSTYSQSDDVLCYCYQTKPIPACLDTLNIPQLANGQTYVAVFTNAFGNEFRFQGLASGGALAVDLADAAFPEQFLNPYTQIKLEVYNSLDLANRVEFTFAGLFYQCLLLNIVDRSPSVSSFTIM